MVRKRTSELENAKTELSKTVEELRKNEELLQGVIENSNEAVFIVDREGSLLLANHMTSVLYGLDDADISGKTLHDVFKGNTADRTLEQVRRVFAESDSISTEESMIVGDTVRTYILTYFPLLDASRMPYAVCGVSTDITERKKMEVMIKDRLQAVTDPRGENESFSFANLFDLQEIQRIQDSFAQAVGVCAVIVDNEDKPITKPSGNIDLCEADPCESEGGKKACRRAASAFENNRNGGPVLLNFENETVWNGAASIGVGEQHLATWLIGRTPNRIDDGIPRYDEKNAKLEREKFVRVLKSLSLITNQLSTLAMNNMRQARLLFERERMERELIGARDNAESANRSKSHFLANMSHEMRTPLNGVLGMMRLLHDTSLSKEQIVFVETALTSGTSLLNIINDILDYSKLEEGKFRLVEKDFELRELLSSVCNSFMAEAMEKKIELNCARSGSELHLLSDPGRIRQILYNLVGNAVKFTEYGSVDVHGEILESSKYVHMQDDEADLFLEIKDSGIGIPQEKIGKVFDAFTQLDGSLSRRYEGTGLGLGIVRRLVQLMNGSISIDSDTGEGTTISVRLRVRRTDKLRGEEGSRLSPQEDLSIPGLKVLVAEDNPVNRIYVVKLLEQMGHTAVTVENGHEALAAFSKEHFDVILMDVQMPEMDGIEATRHIRRLHNSGGKSVPVIAVTAHAMNGDKERFLAEGMDDYIAKPMEKEKLAAVLSLHARRIDPKPSEGLSN
jgi:PAS domain S-box-containing protein